MYTAGFASWKQIASSGPQNQGIKKGPAYQVWIPGEVLICSSKGTISVKQIQSESKPNMFVMVTPWTVFCTDKVGEVKWDVVEPAPLSLSSVWEWH